MVEPRISFINGPDNRRSQRAVEKIGSVARWQDD
jgi:hypothetical protein